MYMSENARDHLLISEKRRFLHNEWPKIAERIGRLGLQLEQLLATTKGEQQ
jgi:GntR family transcriptional regulator